MAAKLLDMEPKRRDAVLNAALKEFALKGYDNASTNVIAKQAGISKPLMFHYIGSKEELFLLVYDYFSELLDKEYYLRMDYTERDIFKRLRKSYILQIELLKQYPWIFELNKLTAQSAEIRSRFDNKEKEKHSACFPDLFDDMDESNFRPGLDIGICKQFIYWSNAGFTNEILEELRNSEYSSFHYQAVVTKLDEYFAELRKIFYTPKNRLKEPNQEAGNEINI